MRIIIVGGVAGGMSAAARARRLDESAEIIVLERGEHVSFANCGLPYYVGGEIADESKLLVQTPESLRAALNLDVRVRNEVTAVDIDAREVTVRNDDGDETLPYDALILSPGGRARHPQIEGIDSPRLHTLRSVHDALALREQVTSGARRAVVLGGGFIGIEAAENLASAGLETTLVQAASHVLTPLEPELAVLVRDELEFIGVDVRERTTAVSIQTGVDHDVVSLSDGTEVPADLIVLSAGVRPDTEVFERAGIACERGAILVDAAGCTSAPSVWAVGDATASVDAVTGVRRPVALAGPANRAGRLVADSILRDGDPHPLPKPVGTAVLRIGGLTAAFTGANANALRDVEIDFETVHLHPLQHAGYFPGAQAMHMIVHFRRPDGLVLGAQIVGADGVDRRIDVLATAIRAQMRMVDLIDLDLAYAPPFGQAKDAVNLAGMVGENVLNGQQRLWHAADLDAVMRESLVVDTRSPQEFADGHLAGSINVPHTVVREHLADIELAAGGRTVRTLCAAGVRSHIATRVLLQHGLDAAMLSGGMQTLRAALRAEGREELITTSSAFAAPTPEFASKGTQS